MLYYSWLDWCMYIWYVNTSIYTDKISEILDCGISNGVDGSKYANSDFIGKEWAIAMKEMNTIYNPLSIWWHPALNIFLTWLLTAGAGSIVFLIINLIFMF